MPDKCAVDPGRDCPNAIKLTLLEKRVDDLEEVETKQEEFRRNYYQEKELRIERDAKLKAKIDAMDEKLDRVVSYQEAQQAKPGTLLDRLKDRALEYILVALLAFLALKLGLSA